MPPGLNLCWEAANGKTNKEHSAGSAILTFMLYMILAGCALSFLFSLDMMLGNPEWLTVRIKITLAAAIGVFAMAIYVISLLFPRLMY